MPLGLLWCATSYDHVERHAARDQCGSRSAKAGKESAKEGQGSDEGVVIVFVVSCFLCVFFLSFSFCLAGQGMQKGTSRQTVACRVACAFRKSTEC